MSYILEALIQAQLERQCRGVPGLYTVQALPGVRPQRRRHWPLVAAAVAGLGGLLTSLAWLQPWHRDAPEVSAPIISSATVAAPNTQAKPAVVSLAHQDAIPGPSAPQRVEEEGEAKVAAVKPNEPRRKHHRRPRKGKGLSGAKIAAAPGPRLYSIAELPAELQKVARGISIAGFAHSDSPKERTAIINNRALREGEEVSGGLRVERIAGDGVIFNLKGYRFRKGRT